jgi:alkylation response protein AidB-like acyl-CoA dehydrogenase
LLKDNTISGTLRFVEGASCASHLVVAVSDRCLAIAEMRQTNVRISESPLMNLSGAADLTLDRVVVRNIDVGVEAIQDLLATSVLVTVARALGAASRAFELVVEYVKERVQFGRPVGSFQAIQHKLANAHIALQAVRLTLNMAPWPRHQRR